MDVPAASPPLGAYALRVAIVYGDTVIEERTVSARARITIGHSPRCTFVLPTGAAAGRTDKIVLVHKGQLAIADDLGGRLHLRGRACDLDELRAHGQASVPLLAEDWGVVHLRHAPWVRVVIQHVRAERKPSLGRDLSSGPLLACVFLAAVAWTVWLTISFLSYDPDRPNFKLENLDERFARAMFNRPPEELAPPDEETDAEKAEEDKPAEKARKRAGGPEGTFGMKDRTNESRIIPRGPNTGKIGNVGVVKELNALSQTDTMGDLLSVGDQIGGLPTGEIIVGGGNYGMSTRGGGQGGGGEGEGELMGTSDVDVGGAGVESRKKKVKDTGPPKEKEVSVATGSPSVRGQLSAELINKEVRRHKAQIRFCYQKQLTRFPNLAGKVTLAWVIAMDGSVTKAKVKSSSLKNSDVESCMLRALQTWKFPKPEGGVVSVDAYPFLFGTQ